MCIEKKLSINLSLLDWNDETRDTKVTAGNLTEPKIRRMTAIERIGHYQVIRPELQSENDYLIF